MKYNAGPSVASRAVLAWLSRSCDGTAAVNLHSVPRKHWMVGCTNCHPLDSRWHKILTHTGCGPKIKQLQLTQVLVIAYTKVPVLGIPYFLSHSVQNTTPTRSPAPPQQRALQRQHDRALELRLGKPKKHGTSRVRPSYRMYMLVIL